MHGHSRVCVGVLGYGRVCASVCMVVCLHMGMHVVCRINFQDTYWRLDSFANYFNIMITISILVLLNRHFTWSEVQIIL